MKPNPKALIPREALPILQQAILDLPQATLQNDGRKNKGHKNTQARIKAMIDSLLANQPVRWSELCFIKDNLEINKALYYRTTSKQLALDAAIDQTRLKIEQLLDSLPEDVVNTFPLRQAKHQPAPVAEQLPPISPSATPIVPTPAFEPPDSLPSIPDLFYNGPSESDTSRLPQSIKIGNNQLIYVSPQMQRVVQVVQRLASEDIAVLILGETGVGKELLASALHNLSKRKDNPFIAINCAAIPSELLESELFGYKKGAFTGAHADKQGYFLSVQEGTLFLDEIGELPLLLQAKILRVLQERKFRMLGGTNGEHDFKGRIVTATNRDLSAEIAERKFRADLFYRIAQFPLEIPPLRDRREDVDPLIDFFLEKKSPFKLKLSRDARLKVHQHSLPGNIRELEQIIDRAIILATISQPLSAETIITAEHIVFNKFSESIAPVETREALEVKVRELEKRITHLESGQK